MKEKNKGKNVTISKYKYYCTYLDHKVNGISEHLKSELHQISSLWKKKITDHSGNMFKLHVSKSKACSYLPMALAHTVC